MKDKLLLHRLFCVGDIVSKVRHKSGDLRVLDVRVLYCEES